MKIKNVLNVLTLPVGVLLAILAMSELTDGMGSTRVGVMLISALVSASFAALVSPKLRAYEAGQVLASMGFAVAVSGGWLWYIMFDATSRSAWGEWGPVLGHIGHPLSEYMAIECIIIAANTMLFLLGVWGCYSLWHDQPRRLVRSHC